MRTLTGTLVLLMSLVVYANCQTATLNAPSEFAVYESEGFGSDFVAVSPDAVKLKVRTTENKPAGSLDALKQTARIHFESIGYKILKTENIRTNDGMPGSMFLTSVQTMNGEYRYLTAFFLDEDEETVTIVESAGSKKDFEKYESKLISSLRTLKIN